MVRVGLNRASTFPGFCERHEQLFSEFEISGAVSTARHVALQAFRTLCREIVRVRLEIANLEAAIEEYRDRRAKYYIASIQKEVPEATVKRVTVTGDGLEKLVVSRLKRDRRDLADIEGDLYDEFFDYVSNRGADPCLEILQLPFEVPLACSGLGEITYKYDGVRRRAFCPLGILPQEGTTMAYIGSAHKHSKAIEWHQARMVVGFGAINAMESWIVNGSDHWFIRPSAWASIPPARQSKILKRILRDRDNIGSFVSISILDDARRLVISYITDHPEEERTNRRCSR
jgi:hypothetical protein